MDIMMMPVSYNASSTSSTPSASTASSTPSASSTSSASCCSSNSIEMVTIDLESEEASTNTNPLELKECYICLHDIALNTGFTLECNHTFHSACYNTFIVHELRVKETNTVLCPACRECIIKIVQRPVDSDEDDYPMLYDAVTERQEIPVPYNDFNAVFNRHRACFVTIQFGMIVLVVWFIASVIACSSGRDTALC
jgi:hypothetical protein